MCLTAIFMPLSSANVIATVYDVTVPEVRSTAQAVEYFIENAGAAFAPIITGIIADMYDLKTAILLDLHRGMAALLLLLPRRDLHHRQRLA
jgi:hypothetical protein